MHQQQVILVPRPGPGAGRAGRPLKALHGSTPKGPTRYVCTYIYYTLYGFWFRFVTIVDRLHVQYIGGREEDMLGGLG